MKATQTTSGPDSKCFEKKAAFHKYRDVVLKFRVTSSAVHATEVQIELLKVSSLN